jgi:hydroxyacylglutathione hydrolase
MTREEFIEDRLNNFMHRPPYFRRMEEWNLRGAPLLLTVPKVKMLNPVDFENMYNMEGTIVLDTREPDSFAASHIPGSINIWLGGATYFTGLVIDYDQRILLVLEKKEDAKTAVEYLHRIGYDDILGYLCVGLKAWRNAGRPTTSHGSIHAPELKEKLENNEVHILDVREAHEWESGHIEGSQNIYVGHLQQEMSKVTREKPIVVHCGWGGRGGIGASILKRNGFKNVYNLLGGMHAWRRFGYDVVLSN